jgi:hypothetical protein
MGRSTGSDWLARYSAGEYEAVWAEMLQLGEALVSAPAYEHARAVAEETMRRARANVELLIERLQAAGYEFQYPEAVHVRPTVAEIARLGTLEGRAGPASALAQNLLRGRRKRRSDPIVGSARPGRRSSVSRRASWKSSASSIRSSSNRSRWMGTKERIARTGSSSRRTSVTRRTTAEARTTTSPFRIQPPISRFRACPASTSSSCPTFARRLPTAAFGARSNAKARIVGKSSRSSS